MQQTTCAECGLTANVKSFYRFDDRIYCEPCVGKVSGEAMAQGRPSQYVALKDNSVCVRCGADNGQADFPLVGDKPFCPRCGELVTQWPYPVWLKTSLACMLALLLVALIHGKKYFRAGSDMYKGERLVHEGHYAEALPYLQRTIEIAPGSDKGVLLLSRAALLTGNVEIAQKAIQGHNGGNFEDTDNQEFREVDALWKRAASALDKVEQASKLADQDGQAAEAARLMHEAAAEYPELPGLAITADALDEGADFERKDYDGFLAITQRQWNQFPSSETAAAMASALACKYAVTGDAQYRQQAEAMLDKAHHLGANDPAQNKSYEEYAERIQYRLKSREIISRSEYNRRFRANQTKKE
jgi:hypothetical protein